MQEIFETTKITLNLVNEIIYYTRIQYCNYVSVRIRRLTGYLDNIIKKRFQHMKNIVYCRARGVDEFKCYIAGTRK